MNNKSVFQRYPEICYFTLVFIISWVGAYVILGPKFLRGETFELIEVLPMGLAILAGPSLSGIAMTYLVDGKEGLQAMFSRFARWRVGGRWYTPLLIFPILILLLSYILGYIVSPDLFPTFFSIGIMMGLMGGFIEEIGWTGFVTPQMLKKRNALSVSLILGFIHAFWHILGDYIGNSTTFGKQWLPYMIGFFVFVWALRVLIIWVYVNTNSLLLAMLMHASSTGFLAIFVPIGIDPQLWVIYYLMYAVLMWIVATIVILRYGKNLVKEPA